MVRSLKVIGAILSFVAGTTSGLSITSSSPQTSPRNWGISAIPSQNDVDVIRTIPISAQRDTPFMMPSTIERAVTTTSTRGAAGPAILDRPATTVQKQKSRAPAKEKKRTGSEAWEVRIYNDGMNTREFVARCLVQITGLSEVAAYQTMMQAHQNGIAVVGRYVYERAEMYYDALKKNGIVCDLVPVDEEK